MIKYIQIVCWLICFTQICKSQNIQTIFADKAIESDIQLAQEAISYDEMELSIQYLNQAISRTKEIKNPNQNYAYLTICNSNVLDGIITHFYKNGEIEDAHKYINILLEMRISIASTLHNSRIEQIEAISTTYLYLAYSFCAKWNDVDYGRDLIQQAINAYEATAIDNTGYADALASMADWAQIQDKDYISALRYHKKRIDILLQIEPLQDAILQDAIIAMAYCYGAMTVQIELDAQSQTHKEFDYLFSMIDAWKTILTDLYDKLGQNYVDSILENSAPSLSDVRDQYWNSDTLISSLLKQVRLYIKECNFQLADTAIKDLINAINLFDRTDLLISAGIEIAEQYTMESFYIQANDIYSDLLGYMCENETSYTKYQSEIEYCNSRLANISGVHLGDTNRAYTCLLPRRDIFGSDESDIRKSYIDINNYINDQLTLCAMSQKIYDFNQALTYALSAHETFIEHKKNILNADILEQNILATLGDIYRSLKKYDEAEFWLKKVIESNNVNHDTNEALWPVAAYMNLANLYYDKQEYVSARNILLLALKYYEKWNPEYAIGPASYLMDIYLKEHNYAEAYTYMSYVWNLTRERILKQFVTMTTDERSLFWNQEWGTQEIYGGLTLLSKSYFDAEYYNIVLFCKGLLLRTERSILEVVETSNSQELKIAYQKMRTAIQNDNPDKKIYEKEVMYLLDRISPTEFNNFTTWSDVRYNLKRKDVAIEFAECWQQQTTMYAALILRKEWDTPKMIPLCTKTELERYTKNKWNMYAGIQSKNMYKLIWSKLEPHINEGDNVYFSPSGLLHQINVEILRDSTGCQANEKYNLYRVSSTRELCQKKPPIAHKSAVLYGGLTYEMDTTAMVAQSRGYHTSDPFTATRGFVADSTLRAGWTYLPATYSEVNSIARQMTEHRVKTIRYVETAGTEESFKALSGKHTPIIHIATHGFFFKDEEAQTKNYFQQFGFQDAPVKEDNSLKRSGLVLAGGQRAWLGETIPDLVEDGILLAEEIATMDLSGTDLVVLSACETGLGEITSEGVFGLQRAFKKAGVQTLIMSLWKVSDEATALMMRTFYKNLLAGKSKRESFSEAQQTVKNKYDSPYYWASFIMLD